MSEAPPKLSPIEREKQEREANAFAMALLMPEELVRDALDAPCHADVLLRIANA